MHKCVICTDCCCKHSDDRRSGVGTISGPWHHDASVCMLTRFSAFKWAPCSTKVKASCRRPASTARCSGVQPSYEGKQHRGVDSAAAGTSNVGMHGKQ